jgi:Glycosyl hydrolase family 76
VGRYRWIACAAALAAVLAHAAPAAASGSLAQTGDLTAARVRLAAAVESGIRAANARWWWRNWYRDTVAENRYSSIWETVQLLEAYAGLAAAQPSTLHRNMLVWFAAKSEAYASPELAGGIGGFTTGYLSGGDPKPNWFDDNGWLGLAFFDAYQLTGQVRWLHDAQRAFRYMFKAGWDSVGGGIWWNSDRTYKCAESVNTAALLAVLLYQRTGDRTYLGNAVTIVDWANAHLLDPRSGLYENHVVGGVPISYLESPMLDALARLCNARGLYCDRVAPLAGNILAAFGGELRGVPQFDAMYVRYLVDAYAATHDARLYAVAYANALRVERNAVNAVNADGYYLRDWDGGGRSVDPGLVSVHGAALEAMAWAAAGATQAAREGS